jgi:hypothetical protein
VRHAYRTRPRADSTQATRERIETAVRRAAPDQTADGPCNEEEACGVKDNMGTTERISALLHEAAETHHVVYRIVDGNDPDWASWYADWLIELSELPEILDAKPVRSQLVYALVELDRNYRTEAPGHRWEDWYAERLPALV